MITDPVSVEHLINNATTEELHEASEILERVRDQFLLCDGPTQGGAQHIFQTKVRWDGTFDESYARAGTYICLWEAVARALGGSHSWNVYEGSVRGQQWCMDEAPLSRVERLALSTLYYEGYTSVWNDTMAKLQEIPEAPLKVAKKLREVAGERGEV